MTLDNQEAPPIECFRCGYNLHTIPDDQPCPECGLLAARSRRPTDELHETSPKWLASISWGVTLLLLAIAFAAACFMIFQPFFAQYLWEHYRSFSFYFRQNFEFIGFSTAGILMLLGVFMLTQREGYEPADRLDRSLRWKLRTASLLLLATIELWIFIGPSPFNAWTFLFLLPFNSTWSLASLALLMLAMASLVLLLFKHLKAIANRARSAHLAEHCTLVGRGAAAAFLFIAIIILLGGRGDFLLEHDWMTKSPIGMAVAMIIAVFASLFILWSLYLLTLFAISFRRAARQVKTKWTRDDRALEPQ
jgi:hypothetical protein